MKPILPDTGIARARNSTLLGVEARFTLLPEPSMVAYLLPEEAPSREEVNSFEGPVLLEFGTGWCGYCRAIVPLVSDLLAKYPDVHHIKVEDGSGRPLGRSFRVQLWPNLVFMRDGKVVQQSARPDRKEIERGLIAITRDPTEESPSPSTHGPSAS
jgi:thioredoxin 1